MRIDVLTIFPEMFASYLGAGLIKRCVDKDIVRINVVNLRDFAHDAHRTTDDVPFGGGGGMVMKPEPIFEAVESLAGDSKPRVILTTPQGKLFSQDYAWELSREPHLIIICGRYEGVDERVRLALATDEISIGDYVLSGGELPAMVIIESVVRLLPGALGNESAPYNDSFSNGLLEGPHYTRPREYRGLAVPEVLLSGNHAKIKAWRRMQMLKRTAAQRPDLLRKAQLSDEDRKYLEELSRSEV